SRAIDAAFKYRMIHLCPTAERCTGARHGYDATASIHIVQVSRAYDLDLTRCSPAATRRARLVLHNDETDAAVNSHVVPHQNPTNLQSFATTPSVARALLTSHYSRTHRIRAALHHHDARLDLLDVDRRCAAGQAGGAVDGCYGQLGGADDLHDSDP